MHLRSSIRYTHWHDYPYWPQRCRVCTKIKSLYWQIVFFFTDVDRFYPSSQISERTIWNMFTCLLSALLVVYDMFHMSKIKYALISGLSSWDWVLWNGKFLSRDLFFICSRAAEFWPSYLVWESEAVMVITSWFKVVWFAEVCEDWKQLESLNHCTCPPGRLSTQIFLPDHPPQKMFNTSTQKHSQVTADLHTIDQSVVQEQVPSSKHKVQDSPRRQWRVPLQKLTVDECHFKNSTSQSR